MNVLKVRPIAYKSISVCSTFPVCFFIPSDRSLLIITSPTVESVEPDNDVSLEGWTSCGAFSDWTNDFYNSSAFQQVASDNDDFLKSLPPYLDGRPVSLQNMVSDDEGRMRDDPSLCKHALLTQDLTVERTFTVQLCTRESMHRLCLIR